MLAIVEYDTPRDRFAIVDNDGNYYHIKSAKESYFSTKLELIESFTKNEVTMKKLLFKPGLIRKVHDVFDNKDELKDKYVEFLI